MDHRMLGFFSGFPSRHFPQAVAGRLAEGLDRNGALVFVSAWPEDHERNEQDSAGMYQMFLEYGLSFANYDMIDSGTEASRAVELIQEGSCIFLMGGHPGKQRQLIRELGLERAIRDSSAAVLGVSAGAINMAERSLDTKESLVPYDGLGLADITVKPHFDRRNQRVLSTLLEISKKLPICAMEDDSAIFTAEGGVFCLGAVHWIYQGKIRPFQP